MYFVLLFSRLYFYLNVKDLPGWKKDLTKLETLEEAPESFRSYVDYLEKQLNVPIRVVSVGPDRKQTLSNSK